MKHIIISRARFKDKELRDKYFKISKEILIPALKNQLNQNFDWCLLIAKDDVSYTQDYFKMNFIPIFSIPQFFEEVKSNKYTIQTRHDIDDWMSPNYVDEIQKIAATNLHYDRFLIQAQPIKLDYHTQTRKHMAKYRNDRTSMFLSLCQQNCDNHILEANHSLMWKIAPKVFTIPEGHVEWVIHGDNISCKRHKL